MKEFTGWVVMDPNQQFVVDGGKFYWYNIDDLTFSQLKNYCYSSEKQANKIIDEIYNWNKNTGLSAMYAKRAHLLLKKCHHLVIFPVELKFYL
jgi:hypothetical protein